MQLSKAQLQQCMPRITAENLEKYLSPLNSTLEKYAINTFDRATIFIAQIAHETGCLKYSAEIASGAAYDTGQLALALGNTPEEDGDGEKYKGRGPFMLTGLLNYKKFSLYTGMDFVNHPELVEGPVWGMESAGWYWSILKKLNVYADNPNLSREYKKKMYNRFEWITLLINGGQNGLEDRLKYYELAKLALKQ